MKLKKCTSFFLAFLILVSSVGFALNVHFCGDSVASVSFKKIQSQTQNKTCCSVNDADNSCCKDKVVHVEKKTPNAVAKVFAFQVALLFASPDYSVVSAEIVSIKDVKKVLSYYIDVNAPPLFKLYNQYIFYA